MTPPVPLFPNERGQVDAWSEKCLPPGTVSFRLPRVASVEKTLEIDFAPAMVGFEFWNGRSITVFEGIMVCVEFKDEIVESYAEEEERREAEEKKRNAAQAISSEEDRPSPGCKEQNVLNRKLGAMSMASTEDVHEFLTDDQNFDEPSFTRTK
ncbi:DNA repair protein Rad4 family [Actinidia rufa]|uniref:DNA repair protein Rad4 family n=1 Tax=Actinidia rufa TaxID=165716 RepID=A0A7J0EN00_9ERIC|nr:DNA repair protein Rad4 family [Actinidia rufa]